MLSYGVVGYLWWITHNELQFMVYWLMSIFNMAQDKKEKGLEKYKKRISLGVGVLLCALTNQKIEEQIQAYNIY
ncbi:hypothetical protein P4576_00100 [Peribacillus frigoritolerans]|uniref:hypothetical protein n=1 Tax=Peribacillus frigoritolerans TaxID=450367 RepID=UPI002E1EF768|nr:hypothetical protein [Peribacillus frigoritolerans]